MYKVKVGGFAIISALTSMIITSQARANAPICDQALALRVNNRGLGFVIEQVKPLIPSQIDVPAITQTLVDWPLTDSDAVVHIASTSAVIKVTKLVAQMDEGALRVQGEADIVTGGSVVVDNPYLGLGTANCDADVRLTKLTLDLALQLRTEGGGVRAEVNRAKISFDPSSEIALKGCTLGNVLTAVVDFVRSHFMGTIQSQLESIAKDKLATMIATKLGETIQVSKEVQGFVFTGRLDTLSTDDAGLAVTLGVGIGAKDPAAAPCVASSNIPQPQSCAGAPAQISPQADAMFAAGISEAVLNQALHTIWRSGKLCVNSADLKLATLTQGMEKLAAGLGQPKGTQLGFAVRISEPPRVRMTQQAGVEVLVKGLFVKLSLTPPGGPVNEVALAVDLAVAGTPWIDPAGNVVSLDLEKMVIGRLELLNQSQIKLDPARLERFLSTVAVPVLRDRLASAPLTASVMNIKDVLVHLRSVHVADGRLAAYVDAYANAPSGDKVPPQTLLLKGPEGDVAPQVLRLLVAGQDNLTPAPLLRFQARVDGGAWSEPRFGGRVDVTVTGGTHVVEVAAIDLDGNVAAPVRIPVRVDDVMPQLVITSRPESFVTTREIEVEFAARDDRTPVEQLRFTAELYRVPDAGGMPELVRKLETASPARLDGLDDGVYKLRVIVTDLAGNVTSEDIGFSIAGGGCALGPAASPSPFALVLLALALAAVRRRRR
jgi:MYXO-CTERM domain-containing protein